MPLDLARLLAPGQLLTQTNTFQGPLVFGVQLEELAPGLQGGREVATEVVRRRLLV